MIISLSGAHCTGKTTLMKALAVDPTFEMWDFIVELTRSVKREYKLDINESGDGLTQLAILLKHMDCFVKYAEYSRNPNKHVIWDRSIVDVFVYTEWLYHHGKVSYYVLDVAKNLLCEMIGSIDLVLYTSSEDVPLEDDGTRSTEVNFRNEIIDGFLTPNDLYRQLYKNKMQILTGDVNKRINQIKLFVEQKQYELENQ